MVVYNILLCNHNVYNIKCTNIKLCMRMKIVRKISKFISMIHVRELWLSVMHDDNASTLISYKVITNSSRFANRRQRLNSS